jgi:hypothetical protein
VLVAPCLDVAETCEFLSLESDDSLCLTHLGRYVFCRTLGDAGATLLSSFGDGCQNGVDVLDVTFVCHHHFYFFHFSLFI